jgi:HEAT repeat protein
VIAGHRGDEVAARAYFRDAEGAVRAAALGALVRMGRAGVDEVLLGLKDPAPRVREQATRAASESRPASTATAVADELISALGDADALVVEGACWALGERGERRAVGVLGEVAAAHRDTRCREGAVAALGAIGDSRGLPAVLGALDDKPTVRRRAAVALAAFGGPEAARALERCLSDRDWQVRQVAERLLSS